VVVVVVVAAAGHLLDRRGGLVRVVPHDPLLEREELGRDAGEVPEEGVRQVLDETPPTRRREATAASRSRGRERARWRRGGGGSGAWGRQWRVGGGWWRVETGREEAGRERRRGRRRRERGMGSAERRRRENWGFAWRRSW
jgi:hypothetical protein